MAVIVKTPDFSFINFDTAEANECVEQVPVCLPVYDCNDIAFPIQIDAVEEEDLTELALIGTDIFYVLQLCDANCDYEPDFVMSIARFLEFDTRPDDISQLIGRFTLSDETCAWFSNLANGECFKLCLFKINFTAGTPWSPDATWETEHIGCSQNFCKISDPCYTTLLKYRGNDDQFGFWYSGIDADFYNTIRLPFYAKHPQFPSEKEVYRKSSGEIINLSTFVREEYTAKVDLMPKAMHKKLILALQHDTVIITSTNAELTDEQISMIDEYKIDWEELIDYPNALAEFKFSLMNDNSNSNCN